MNCVLLDSGKFELPADSPKLAHIRDVLRTPEGGEVFAGVKNAGMFLCRVFRTPGGGARFEPVRRLPDPPPAGIDMAVPFTRPQIAKRLLFESACFGVGRLVFYPSDKSESSYAESSLYASGGYAEWLERGAEQACCSSVPSFETASCLSGALKIISRGAGESPLPFLKLAPDPYEASAGLLDAVYKGAANGRRGACALALGGERGFSDSERRVLRGEGFALCLLGARILRTDTAAICALSLIGSVPCVGNSA